MTTRENLENFKTMNKLRHYFCDISCKSNISKDEVKFMREYFDGMKEVLTWVTKHHENIIAFNDISTILCQFNCVLTNRDNYVNRKNVLDFVEYLPN